METPATCHDGPACPSNRPSRRGALRAPARGLPLLRRLHAPHTPRRLSRLRRDRGGHRGRLETGHPASLVLFEESQEPTIGGKQSLSVASPAKWREMTGELPEAR